MGFKKKVFSYINFEFSYSNYTKAIFFEIIKGKKKNLRITVKFDSTLQEN